MKMLPEDQWVVERIPGAPDHVGVSVGTNQGYRHWAKVKLTGRREVRCINMNDPDWPVVATVVLDE
jgi:hypothetical protein